MNERLLAALLGSFLLAGCLPKPTVLTMEQIRRMDYGSYPRNYEQLVKRHLAQTLIDPHSVMYGGFSQPRKYLQVHKNQYVAAGQISYYPSYMVCARVNAKNSYGGYTGWQTHAFFIKNGEVINSDQHPLKCDSQDEIVLDIEALANVEVQP